MTSTENIDNSTINKSEEKIEVNLDNSSLIEYLETQKQEEIQKQEEEKLLQEKQLKEEEKTLLEETEKEIQILESNIKFQEDLLKELKEIKQVNYEMSLKNDEFNRMIYNEQVSFHNDFYIFIGIFISAFVVLIFSRSWFSNVL